VLEVILARLRELARADVLRDDRARLAAKPVGRPIRWGGRLHRSPGTHRKNGTTIELHHRIDEMTDDELKARVAELIATL